jgi:ParB family chromosome partitioning protein
MTTTEAEVVEAEAPTEVPEAAIAATSLVYLDPAALAANPANVRSELGDLTTLVASIRSIGVLEPLIVIPDGDGGHLIVAGHRRNAAAIEAEQGSVPCLVRPDLAAAHATAQVVAMLIENTQRLALTPGDEARGYEQLRIGGLSANKIAKAVGQKPAHIKRALAVAGSELANAAIDRYDLTLEQAAVLAEFDGDDDAVKNLVLTAKQNPGRWSHTVSRLREDRKTAAAYAAAVGRLEAAGVTVIERPYGRGGPVQLHELVDSDGAVLDHEAHAACPGHAAAVNEARPDDVSYYCIDPAANGHKDRWERKAPAVVGGKMTEEAKAERREVIENNKAWRAAEPVRRDYIRDLLGRKSPPKGTLRFAVSEVLSDPDRVGDGKDSLLADLLHKPEPGFSYGRQVGAAAAAGATEARLPLLLLAQVAADREQSMNEGTWRSVNPRAARWFLFLSASGYTLADVEQRVVNDAADANASQADGDGPDDGDSPDEGHGDSADADDGQYDQEGAA